MDKKMDQNILNKTNRENIKAAGPRYTPAHEIGSPNLEIESLIQATDALAQAESFSFSINQIKTNIQKAWEDSPDTIRKLPS